MSTLQLSSFNYLSPPFPNAIFKFITSTYFVSGVDNGVIINCTANSGTVAVNLISIGRVPAGFNFQVWNTGGINITLVPSVSDQIGSSVGNGHTSSNPFALRRGQGVQLISDGSFWHISSAKIYGNYRNVVAIGTFAGADNNGAVAIGPGSFAGGVGSVGIGSTLSSTTANVSANSNWSTAIGSNSSNQGSQTVTGAGAMALGGSYASGTDSFAAAISNNTNSYGAQGENSIAIGRTSKTTSSYGVAVGWGHLASGTYAAAMGGISSTASGEYSVIIGSWGKSSYTGKYVYSNWAVLDIGDNQYGLTVLAGQTSSAVAKILTAGAGTVDNNNQVVLPNNSAYAFTGTVVARRNASAGTDSAAWKVEGLIRREGTAASTTLVASTVTAISNVPGWTLALSADTTRGALAITATGAASTNIIWVATIQATEVVYA